MRKRHIHKTTPLREAIMRPIKEVMESRNMAIFGASHDPFKPGSMLLQMLKDNGFKGQVAGINPKGGQVNGIPLFPAIQDVPFDVDLAVMIIPPRVIPEAIAHCARKGVKGVVIASEGFGETGAQGRQYQEAVSKMLKKTGIRAFGPNTLGIINTETGLTTSYFTNDRMMRPGSIGFAAQSGIFVGAFLRYLASFDGLHISKGMGLGNKVDVDECDALDYFAQDRQTRTIGMYLEDVRDGKRFIKAARTASREKPVLILKGGRTRLGAKATASHTASLAVDDAVFDGALRQAGILRMNGIDDMLGTLMGFEWMPLPKGNNIAIATYSGAQAILSIDAAVQQGVDMAELTPRTIKHISTVIPTASKAKNPIDMYPDMMVHGFEKTSCEILRALLRDDGVHGIMFITFSISGEDIFTPLIEVIREHPGKPVFISLMGDREDTKGAEDFMRKNRIPVYAFPEMGIQTFARMRAFVQMSNSP